MDSPSLALLWAGVARPCSPCPLSILHFFSLLPEKEGRETDNSTVSNFQASRKDKAFLSFVVGLHRYLIYVHLAVAS